DDIMSEEKGNQIPKINIPYTRVQKFLPRNVVTPKEVETFFTRMILKKRRSWYSRLARKTPLWWSIWNGKTVLDTVV
ncbi:MAG: hypothetical protein IJ936_03615, partial [Peptococcaceae bacterium]|nr:hypothetical protein [Peptococcaceae bacterium]